MIIMLNKQISRLLYISICLLVVVFTLDSCTIQGNSNKLFYSSKSAPIIRNQIDPEPRKCYAKAKNPGHETYDWVEVVCELSQTKNLMEQIQQKLSALSMI